MIETIRRLARIYPRVVDEIGVTSRGKSGENSDGYTPNRDPRRAPVNMDALDLLDTIERQVPDLTRWLTEACGWINCRCARRSYRGSTRIADPAVVQSFETLLHYWPLVEDYARDTAEAIHGRLGTLLARAERVVGDTRPPVALSATCPSCREPSIFRVDTGHGWKAVCSNPADADEGRRREWSETEWEDAHHPARSVYAG